jgi:hypothetical protein
MRLDDLDVDAGRERWHRDDEEPVHREPDQMPVHLDDVAAAGDVADPMLAPSGHVLVAPQDEGSSGFFGRVAKRFRGAQPRPEHVIEQPPPAPQTEGYSVDDEGDGRTVASSSAPRPSAPHAAGEEPAVATPGRFARWFVRQPARAPGVAASDAGRRSIVPGTSARQRNFAPYFGVGVMALLVLAVLLAQLREKPAPLSTADPQRTAREQSAALLGGSGNGPPSTTSEPPKAAVAEPPVMPPPPSQSVDVPAAGPSRYVTMLDQIKDGRVLPPASTEPAPLPSRVQPTLGGTSPPPAVRATPESPPKRVDLIVEGYEAPIPRAAARPADPLAGRVAVAGLRPAAVRPQSHGLARIEKVDGEWMAYVRAPGGAGWWVASGDRLPTGWTVVEVTAATVRLNGPEGEIEELR